MFTLSAELARELARYGRERARRPTATLAVAMAPGSAGPEEKTLEADDIQGNILPGFTMRHQRLVGLRIRPDRLADARRWLQGLLPTVTAMAEMSGFRAFRRTAREARPDADRLPAVALNVAISMPGLRLFTSDADEIRDEAFKGGLYGATTRLGDPAQPGQPGRVADWGVGASEAATPHLLLIFGSDDRDGLRQVWERVSAPLRDAGSAFDQPWYEEEGHKLSGDVEHFGFRDGISQPGVRGRLPSGEFVTQRQLDPADPRAVDFAAPGKPLVWPGQFLFGHETQLPDTPLVPGPVRHGGPPWMRNGSFLVFRRLRQDVAAFRAFFAALATTWADVPELARLSPPERAGWLAAHVVGRWPSGAPLMRHPDGDPSASGLDPPAMNHFGFRDGETDVRVIDDDGSARTITGCPPDFLGTVCPTFAHIRKVNPRDIDTDKGVGEGTRSLQMLRRGIPFGELYDRDPTGERGLLFLAYQTTIQKMLDGVHGQFELLVTDWMNLFGPPQDGGFDLLVGQNQGRPREARLVFPQSGPRAIVVQDPWVIPTGGGYFFAPSKRCLASFLA